MTGKNRGKVRSTKTKGLAGSNLLVIRSASEASRGEFVYQSLLEAIRHGRLRQGERIREDEISDLLKVSRTPVREALHKMEIRGLLNFAAGGRLFVATLSREKIVELYAIRELLEGGAARFAAQYASSHEIDTLRHVVRALEEIGDDFVTGDRLNKKFHQTIHAAARNIYLAAALNDTSDIMSLLQTGTLPDRCVTSLVEHRRIVEAIEARAPDEAELAARHHVREAFQAQSRLWTISGVAAAGA